MKIKLNLGIFLKNWQPNINFLLHSHAVHVRAAHPHAVHVRAAHAHAVHSPALLTHATHTHADLAHAAHAHDMHTHAVHCQLCYELLWINSRHMPTATIVPKLVFVHLFTATCWFKFLSWHLGKNVISMAGGIWHYMTSITLTRYSLKWSEVTLFKKRPLYSSRNILEFILWSVFSPRKNGFFKAIF
jgi:hypothetical protein